MQKNGISEENIARFLAYAPEVNTTWLLTGKGEMTITPKSEELNGSHNVIAITTDRTEGIPLIPLNAAAGLLSGETTVLDYECERYIIPAFQGADFLIQVKGDSMQPTYQSGDLVACKRVPLGGIFFQWNKSYVLDTSQGALIKRIKPGHDNEHVKIISDNPDYDPFELHISEFYHVALVIGMLRLE